MSNYKSKIYAKALSDLILKPRTPADKKKLITNFLKLLEKNGDIKKAKEIIFLTEKLFFLKTGQRKIILETARKVDLKNILVNFLREGDYFEDKVNPDIIAGLKIVINNNKQLDFSLKSKLDKVFK